MLQYHPVFKLPHGNAVFGERRRPELAPAGSVTLPAKISYFYHPASEQEEIKFHLFEKSVRFSKKRQDSPLSK
jgi:hypothetical protein